jgi:hypothetical protein
MEYSLKNIKENCQVTIPGYGLPTANTQKMDAPDVVPNCDACPVGVLIKQRAAAIGGIVSNSDGKPAFDAFRRKSIGLANTSIDQSLIPRQVKTRTLRDVESRIDACPHVQIFEYLRGKMKKELQTAQHAIKGSADFVTQTTVLPYHSAHSVAKQA